MIKNKNTNLWLGVQHCLEPVTLLWRVIALFKTLRIKSMPSLTKIDNRFVFIEEWLSLTICLPELSVPALSLSPRALPPEALPPLTPPLLILVPELSFFRALPLMRWETDVVFPLIQLDIDFRVNLFLSDIFRLTLEWADMWGTVGEGEPTPDTCPSLKAELIVIVLRDVMICFWFWSVVTIDGICVIIWCDFLCPELDSGLCLALTSRSFSLTMSWVSFSSIGNRETS